MPKAELEAAETLASAAGEMERHPIALQLRTLSTLSEIAAERNSTIIFHCRSSCCARWNISPGRPPRWTPGRP